MRILFHYTHKQTLGHTTRSISLATAFCRHKSDILILQGGQIQPFIRFPKGAIVKDIPSPFDTRESFQSHVIPHSSSERAKFILRTAAAFKPDVFITEFFPFGRLAYAAELLPTLKFLRKKGTKIISSIGYPLIIDLNKLQDKSFAAIHRAIFALYDAFLIHTPQELENTYIHQSIQSPVLADMYQRIMDDLKDKIKYTGYVFPEQVMVKQKPLPKFDKKAPLIVVSRGGGAVYPNIITCAIEAQRLIKDNIHMIISTGPATTDEEKALFQSCLKPKDLARITLIDQTEHLDQLFQDCKVSISLCGYNTSVQLMRFGTPSILVPYQNTLSRNTLLKTTTNDQVARAHLMQERFQAQVIEYDKLNAQTLAQAIRNKLKSPKPKSAPASWFNGAETTARWVLEDKLD